MTSPTARRTSDAAPVAGVPVPVAWRRAPSTGTGRCGVLRPRRGSPGDLRWGSIPSLVAEPLRFADAEAVDRRGHPPDLRRADREAAGRRPPRPSRRASIRGDRVAIWAPNCAEWMLAALGTLGAGAVLVPAQHPVQGRRGRLRAAARREPRPVHRAWLPRYRLPGHAAWGGRPRTWSASCCSATTRVRSELTRTDEVPIFGWHEFLAGDDGVVECDEACVGLALDVRAERAALAGRRPATTCRTSSSPRARRAVPRAR